MAASETPAALAFQSPDESQYEAFLALMQSEAADYLEAALRMMNLTWEAFARLVRTVGQVYTISHQNEPVGYVWIEQREKTLHLHGLFIMSACQGRGYGKAVLRCLAEQYRGQVNVIELGVHQSNAKARGLYEKVGFHTVRHIPELGFEIMQWRVAENI